MVASAIALLCVAQAGVQPVQLAKQDEITKLQLAAWTEALRSMSDVEGITVVFDVNPQNSPPGGYQRRLGRAGLSFVAMCCGRSYSVKEGVHTFTRIVDASKKSYASHVAEFGDFASSLQADSVAKLTAEGLPLSSLTEAQLPYLAKVLSYPTGGPGAALGNWEKSALRARLLPAVEFKDPTTGKLRRISLIEGPESDQAVERRMKAIAGKPLPFTPLEYRASGELQFAKGEVKTLREFALAGEEAFKVKFVFDRRLAESFVFVQGSFDLIAFQESIKALTKTPGASLVPQDSRSAQEAFDSLLLGALSHIRDQEIEGYGALGAQASDFLDGKSMKAADLYAGNRELQALLASKGVPSDATVKLVGGLGLQVLTLGTRTVRDLVDGRWTERQVPTWQSTVPLKISP